VKLKAVMAGVVLVATGTSYGQSSDAILDLLIKKGVINQREANEVREQLDQQTQQAVEMYSKTKAGSWLDGLVFTGDLRLRGEYFDLEKSLNQADRLRFRYRLRYGVEAQYHDWATVNLRLASGDGDSVSVNQTLTDTFRKKPINIDVASVTIQPPGWNWVKVIAGKMDLPIWQPKFNSPMVYDFDVTPEGVAEQFQWTINDHVRLFAQAGQYAVKEFSKDANDVYFFDQEGGVEAKFGQDPKSPVVKVTAVGGYYVTDGLGLLKAGDSPNLGNALVGASATTNNIADFNVGYVRGEVAWKLCDKPFLGTPAMVTLSGEYDKNLKSAFENLPDDQTTGWTGQIVFGEAKKKHQWQIAYQYKYQEADSTWDAIADSDFGNGGTDRKGHVIKAAYNLQDWWQLGFATFLTEKISNRPNTGHNTVGFAGQEQLRLQVDSVFKF
jgi:hypothetical protein